MFVSADDHQHSAFLRFIRSEFMRRGTDRRLAMSDKRIAHEFAAQAGASYPKKIGQIASLSKITEMQLPDRFVIKPVRGWSTRGVMLVSRSADGTLFDHFSMRSVSLDELSKSKTDSEDNWILETAVESTVAGKPIPLDYKFYCFRDKVGIVVQIDRNTNPVNIALLDSHFRPLRHATDYIIIRDNAKLGDAIAPLHGPDLLRTATNLSILTDSPFVSVDLYDSPEGPQFGEFTFSPGGTHKRMWAFSKDTLAQIETLFSEAQNLGGIPAGPTSYSRPSPIEYSYLAANVANGCIRSCDRLAALYEGDTTDAEMMRNSWLLAKDRLSIKYQKALQSRQSKSGLFEQ